MTTIPYDKKIIENDGAFIKPDGTIIYTYGEHEKFAGDYLRGKDYNYLARMKFAPDKDLWEQIWSDYKKAHNLTGNRENIDLFLSSKITKEELELYKLWIEKTFCAQPSEFLIRVLGYDKIGIIGGRRITTTSPMPHVKYFNYDLMDFHITKVNLQRYNFQNAEFEEVARSFIVPSLEREYEEELETIKSKVLQLDRIQYFK